MWECSRTLELQSPCFPDPFSRNAEIGVLRSLMKPREFSSNTMKKENKIVTYFSSILNTKYRIICEFIRTIISIKIPVFFLLLFKKFACVCAKGVKFIHQCYKV